MTNAWKKKPHPHFDDPAWYYAGDYRWLKRRTVWEISRRLQNAMVIRDLFIKNQYKKWYDQALKIGSFWGPAQEKNYVKNGNNFIILDFHGDGFSHDWVKDPNKFSPEKAETRLRMMDPKELPLLLEDPEFQIYKKTIEKLLSGELTHSHYKPDLVDIYYKHEIRLSHMNKLTGTYRNMLKDFFAREFSDLIYDKWERDALFIITVGDNVYHLFSGRSDTLSFIPKIHQLAISPDKMIV